MGTGPLANGPLDKVVNPAVHSETVSTEAILSQLEKILASPGFVHSDRMARFLRFTVEQTLQGDTDSLKESVLGMEVFDRTASFDPRTDTIVRVEARRLRSKLKEYYETQGQRDTLRIEFPKGSYVPTFLGNGMGRPGELPTPSEGALKNEAKPSQRSFSPKRSYLPNRRIALTLAALVGAGVATLWWRLTLAPKPVEWRLRALTADDGLTTTPALSSDGKLAAYASDRASQGTNLDLWVHPLTEGVQPIRLTENPADDMNPSFSPDGGQIAFFSSREGGGIYLIPALGGPERLLVRGGHDPRFSPDGRWIAYSSGCKSYLAESKVFIIPVGGDTPKQIAVDIPWASGPVWSPDGRRLLVLAASKMNDLTSLDFWLVSPDGGASARTGLVLLLRAQQVFPPIGGLYVFSLDWIGDTLVFGNGPSIWTIEFKHGSRQPSELRKIVSGTTAMMDVRGFASTLVFESRTAACHLWSLPLDLNSGKILGPLQPLRHAGGSQTMPASSSDGRWLAYLQSSPGSQELRLRDMSSGTEKVLGIGNLRPKVSPDGTKVAYSLRSDPGPLFLKDSSGGEVTRLLDPSGGVTIYGWSVDGKRIVYWNGSPIRFSLFDLETRRASVLLSHPTYDIHGAELSPDGKWAAFHLPRAGSEHLNIAPVRKGTAAPEREWVTVTTVAGSNRRPWWSPDGNLLYFLSTRDNNQCIWAQPLNPGTKEPSGDPKEVYHFHEARSSLNLVSPGAFGPAIGDSRLIFALGEQSGNIWLAEPEK